MSTESNTTAALAQPSSSLLEELLSSAEGRGSEEVCNFPGPPLRELLREFLRAPAEPPHESISPSSVVNACPVRCARGES
jgi:hypothetical protein